MNVRVVSQDEKLYGICQAIRAASPECSWQLVNGELSGASGAETDLHIWDFDPNLGIAASVRHDPLKHLFLVDRKDLAAFQASIGRTDLAVLLKPVTRATLAAFLGLAVSAHTDRISTTIGIRAERDEILQCLIQANLKLQEFDLDRTNFLARALHDFRSPLTSLNGYCDLLLAGALGPLSVEQSDVIRKMNRSAHRLSQMTSAMYELSVGRQARLPLDRQEGYIEDCIVRALQETHSVAAAKNILLTTNIATAGHPLFFDPRAIEQVLVHLLENACKFTVTGGTVELAAYPFFWERRRISNLMPMTGDRRRRHSGEPNAYRIDILNPELRIPDQHLQTMFEEYTSYSGGTDRSGGGLGLAICRMNIARHDGRLWAENREAGSAFSFVLPALPLKASA
jgi:signal transduction histidine kinase